MSLLFLLKARRWDTHDSAKKREEEQVALRLLEEQIAAELVAKRNEVVPKPKSVREKLSADDSAKPESRPFEPFPLEALQAIQDFLKELSEVRAEWLLLAQKAAEDELLRQELARQAAMDIQEKTRRAFMLVSLVALDEI